MAKKKNKRIIIILSIALLALAIVGMFGTYALWMMDKWQESETSNYYKCFDISYSQNVNEITQISSYPMTDEKGLSTDVYSVTITNTCGSYATYNLNLTELNDSTLSADYLKIAVNGNISLLSSNSKIETDTSIANAKSTYTIASGGLSKDESITYNFQEWMDYNTTEAQGYNKVHKCKLTVDSVAANTPLLASVIKNRVVTTGDGVYTSSGYQGKTIYDYKGSDPNNYLKINDLNFRILKINEDGSIRIVGSKAVGPSFYSNVNEPTYLADSSLSVGFLHSSLVNWYNSNIVNNNLESYFVNGDYCNDTSYGARLRRAQGNQTQNCPVTPLKLNIGVISIDEYDLAGGSSSYLKGNSNFWTMTPYSDTDVYYVAYNSGSPKVANRSANSANTSAYPVINLRADVQVRGDGSASNPFTLVEK